MVKAFALSFCLLVAGLVCLGQGRAQLSLTGAGKGGSGGSSAPITLHLTNPNNLCISPWVDNANINSCALNETDPMGSSNAATGYTGVNAAFANMCQDTGITPTGGQPYTVSGYFKKVAGGATWQFFYIDVTGGNDFGSWYDLSGSGTLGSTFVQGTASLVSRIITAAASSWYLITFTGAFSSASTSMSVCVLPADADSSFGSDGQKYGAWQVGP